MNNLDQIRDLLISSLHSDEEAKAYFKSRLSDLDTLLKLCVICGPHDSYSNDPRMEAAFYISQYPPELVKEVIPCLITLLCLPNDGEDMNGNIACHLIKAIRSAKDIYTGTVYLDLDKIAEEYGCH